MQTSAALLIDLYQLTQAQAYYLNSETDLEASFYLHFRENPFNGGYSIACGMAQVVELIEQFQITATDIEYLSTLKTASEAALFQPEFLNYLSKMQLQVDIDAVPEGSLVFPNEPFLRVSGPIFQCQLLETPLLNQVGFQTLVATKAARICDVADGPVAEFGLRRAQGPAGGIYASRAAMVGGCASTSNVEAGRLFDLPVSGTHAHSWVMAHASELEAFRAFALTQPEGCVLLVDTYDTIHGVQNAITVAHEIQARGQRLQGIRIDSGDLAWLSKKAREMLDQAGFNDVLIIASNDLDEYTIQSLRDQGAAIDSYGVGTRLATAYETPALTAVYKLSAVRPAGQESWNPALKVSEQLEKSTLPGRLDVRRYYGDDGLITGDMIYSLDLGVTEETIIDPRDDVRRKQLPAGQFEQLLKPLARQGQIVWPEVSVMAARANCKASLDSLDTTRRRLMNPHSYPVGLEPSLHSLRDRLRRQAKGL
ncbi:MAG: nicotinate phosphoribosyltransferase [Coriobacteriales bacterium]|jgi:nicotinate phosphoribosyltransferase|nr:nicotinate phosphoribosyltransferase [Coriobacteriales bacterium]